MAKWTLMLKDPHSGATPQKITKTDATTLGPQKVTKNDAAPSPRKITKTDAAQKDITSSLSPSKIHSSDPHVTVQALVASVSLVKPSKYFDCELTDGDSIIHFVGFNKCQQEQLHTLYNPRH